jgi:hypothetical protein
MIAHLSDIERDRTENGLEAIGEALAEERDLWFYDHVGKSMPGGFSNGLAAHYTAWLRNVWMRGGEHEEYLWRIANAFEEEGILRRCNHPMYADCPSWEVVR